MRAHVNAKHPMAAEILSSSTESENVLECSLATSAQCSTKDNHREAKSEPEISEVLVSSDPMTAEILSSSEP